MWDKPKVLFLCTGHPERSEMAEGFLRRLAGQTVIPVSAAIEPAPVSPLAVDAMKEVGIDISHQEVKDVPEVFKERFAYAVGRRSIERTMPGFSVCVPALLLELGRSRGSPGLAGGTPCRVPPRQEPTRSQRPGTAYAGLS